jgi:molybdopterin/thiamine biosynthesis adenylyltransferase
VIALTPAQQERYSRHLLLDGWGGEGQERLLAASVRVRGQGAAALWAARYLAAAGVGRLVVDTEEMHTECRTLNVDCSVVRAPAEAQLDLAPSGGPFEGAQAALAALRSLLP